MVCHAKRGLQQCLRLDGSDYTHVTADRTRKFQIRVKAVSEALVRAFQVVSDGLSSSLRFQNIPGTTSEEVLSIAQDIARKQNVAGPIQAALAPARPNTGVLYFDTLSSAISFEKAINSDANAVLCEGQASLSSSRIPVPFFPFTQCSTHIFEQASRVKLAFNTDSDSQSSKSEIECSIVT
jgi:hypothetical protein